MVIRTYLEKQIRWIIKMVKNEQRYNNHKVSVQQIWFNLFRIDLCGSDENRVCLRAMRDSFDRNNDSSSGSDHYTLINMDC